MSEHIAEVVPVVLEPHPDPETVSLSLVKIGGYQVVVRTEDWLGVGKGIYVLPDSIVSVDRPEFAFLNRGRPQERIKAIRLRGAYSQGLLIPTPPESNIGDDYFDRLGLGWYEPPMEAEMGGDFVSAPPLWKDLWKYDVENLRSSKIRRLFSDGEMVSISFKLNGSNTSFVFSEGQMWARSRSGFRADSGNLFWQVLRNAPEVEIFCRENPDTLVYGEAYGNVKSYNYDCNGKPSFRIFDIMKKDRTYMNVDEFLSTCEKFGLQTVPQIGILPFDFDKMLELAESSCPLGNKVNEGIVIKPVVERRDYLRGRVIAKVVSNQYLTAKN